MHDLYTSVFGIACFVDHFQSCIFHTMACKHSQDTKYPTPHFNVPFIHPSIHPLHVTHPSFLHYPYFITTPPPHYPFILSLHDPINLVLTHTASSIAHYVYCTFGHPQSSINLPLLFPIHTHTLRTLLHLHLTPPPPPHTHTLIPSLTHPIVCNHYTIYTCP